MSVLDEIWTRPTVVETRQADGTWLTETLALGTVEFRPNRPYDEQHPGHVVHPNGSLIGSLDRQFLGAAARLVIAMLVPSGCAFCGRPVVESGLASDGGALDVCVEHRHHLRAAS